MYEFEMARCCGRSHVLRGLMKDGDDSERVVRVESVFCPMALIQYGNKHRLVFTVRYTEIYSVVVVGDVEPDTRLRA